MSKSEHDGGQGQATTEGTQLSENLSEHDIREAYVHVLEEMGASSVVIDAARQAAAEGDNAATGADTR